MTDISAVDEQARLEALYHYDILDTPADGAFDRITSLVSNLLDVPVAIVSLVDRDRIWFKSHHGVDVPEIGREPGLCASAILQDSFYEVTDAAVDPRTLANPLVAGEMGVRFYMAHPLTTEDGHNLGTLCVLDVESRSVTDVDRQVLGTMADLVMEQMNLRLSARRISELNVQLSETQQRLEYEVQHDSLTRIWNRAATTAFLERSVERFRRTKLALSVVMLDLDHFKSVNDTYGHPAGDEVLIETARRLTKTARSSDALGRLGGEEFLIVLDETAGANAVRAAERMRSVISDTPYTITTEDGPLEVPITASLGVATNEHDPSATPETILKRADVALYRAKTSGRNRVTVEDERGLLGDQSPVASM